MKAKELIKALKRLVKENKGNDVEVYLFAHDQDDGDHMQGDGAVMSVTLVTNDAGETFVSIRA